MKYRTIAAACESSVTEKRSEFIAQLFPIQSVEDFNAVLEAIRAKHHKARHHVWCYRLRADGSSRYSDDGEPQGTGGIPILSVLQKADLTDVGCVVTRYFGGVLLGASGLTRAYSAAAALAVQKAPIQCFCEALRIRLTIDYGLYGKLSYLLPTYQVLDAGSDFGELVTLEFDVQSDLFPALEAKLIELFNGAPPMKVLQTHYVDFSSVTAAP